MHDDINSIRGTAEHHAGDARLLLIRSTSSSTRILAICGRRSPNLFRRSRPCSEHVRTVYKE